MIAVGVASPSAQGQAMTSTATAGINASVHAPECHHQPANVSNASAMTTGTNTPEMVSASRWIGALEPCASSTRRMMPASAVSAPTPVARQRSNPWALRVAA